MMAEGAGEVKREAVETGAGGAGGAGGRPTGAGRRRGGAAGPGGGGGAALQARSNSTGER